MKMKCIISILTAAVITASCAVNTFALSDDIYSADSAVPAQVLTQLTDEEKSEFVNEHLDKKEQHLSTLVTMTANQQLDLLADEIESALNDGVSAVEIKEAIYHSGAYCGITRAAEALDAADAALAALGEDTEYSSRITWSEDERYDKGLAVQRYLFGSQIGTITDDMEESLKMQTLFLSGICFGDFYNRSGLSLYTREFLTLCTIAANGNCASQLSGHVSGNLNIGHDKDMLRAAMLLNEEYNGAEKTELALEVINSSTVELNESPSPEPEISENTVETSYSSDSEEILAIFDHFKADDTDGYIDANLDAATQELLNAATEAVIAGTEIPTSDNAAVQALIDIAVMTAEGGREDEIPVKIAQSLAAGNTTDMMLAVPLLTAPYNGFPRTLNMRGTLAAAIEETTSDAAENMTITMQIDNPVMTVNGADNNIDDNGTAPVIVDDRTLLPIRAFVEAIGGSVDWNGDTSTATLSYNGDVITLTIGSTTAYLNSTANELDVAPTIINDRTMLPIRFIAESFGFDVEWDSDTETVTITGAAISATEAAAEPTAEPTVLPTQEPEDEISEDGDKVLIVYYSATGTTEKVANTIADALGGDLFEIVPVEPYTDDDLDWTDENSRVTLEHDNELLRDVELVTAEVENWDEYDTVFIGYPIWWGIAAWPVNNFVKVNDFTGKTVIPFCTSSSSGIGESGELLEEMTNTGTWLEGERLRSSVSENDILDWVDEPGL